MTNAAILRWLILWILEKEKGNILASIINSVTLYRSDYFIKSLCFYSVSANILPREILYT